MARSFVQPVACVLLDIALTCFQPGSKEMDPFNAMRENDKGLLTLESIEFLKA